MRVSTTQAFGSGINSIQDIYSDLLRTQEQVSSGKRVLTPSDDPVAATRILNLQEDNALISRYRDNITLANNNLSEEESILTSVLTAVQRLEELTIQAGDGALTNEDREAIALESQQIYEQLVSLGNSQNARGEYLFAGSQANIQPFQLQPDGSVVYVGDASEREVEIAGGNYVSIRDSGFDVFQHIDNSHRIASSSNSTVGYYIGAGNLADEQAFDNYYDQFTAVAMPQTTTLTMSDNRDAADPNFPDVPLDFTFAYIQPDGTGPIASTNINYLNADTYATDGFLEVEVDMTAEMGQVYTLYLPVDENGFVVGAGGATTTEFSIDRQETQGLMATAYALTQLLQQPAEESAANQHLSDRLGAILDNLDNAGRNLDTVSARIGARMNVLESTDYLHEDSEIYNAEALANIEDIDFAKALSDLSLQETILQAAQQSYVRVTSLSLFDRLG
ncbi:flagellar hook-associated protein FlgL [Halioxenophilus sp. WMMB6]|uniref:flagellar hook-associated protein FlgL n=1 Tax=Halioxenophilus sp. WMMB6 TaxID=3073815 RepID=UPI00295E8C4C|nr:flagellar hook-associated protein FlgL [Halioxenophilus sp. WMMB6]